MVVHAFNLSTWKAEAGAFLSSRPAWSTEFQDSQGYKETLQITEERHCLRKKKKKEEEEEEKKNKKTH